MFTVSVPGARGTAVLRVGGRRGVPAPASGPAHPISLLLPKLRVPAAASPCRCSSHAPFLCLWVPHVLCLVQQTPSSRTASHGSFPRRCALPACGFCFVQLSTVTVNQGTFFSLRTRGPGSAWHILPCSSQHFPAGTC